jgi:hypothetical protein
VEVKRANVRRKTETGFSGSLFAEKNDAPNLHHRNMPPERWGFIKEFLEADG